MALAEGVCSPYWSWSRIPVATQVLLANSEHESPSARRNRFHGLPVCLLGRRSSVVKLGACPSLKPVTSAYSQGCQTRCIDDRSLIFWRTYNAHWCSSNHPKSHTLDHASLHYPRTENRRLLSTTLQTTPPRRRSRKLSPLLVVVTHVLSFLVYFAGVAM